MTIIFFAFFTSLISCDLDSGPSVKSLPDSRFNGDFSRLISSPSGAFHGLDSYTFNGTNRYLNIIRTGVTVPLLGSH